MKKKKTKRTWQGIPSPVSISSPIKNWQVVLAELQKGKVSVGIRFNNEPEVHFFIMYISPEESVHIVKDIADGKMTLKDIANYDWKAIELPVNERSN